MGHSSICPCPGHRVGRGTHAVCGLVGLFVTATVLFVGGGVVLDTVGVLGYLASTALVVLVVFWWVVWWLLLEFVADQVAVAGGELAE